MTKRKKTVRTISKTEKKKKKQVTENSIRVTKKRKGKKN